MIFEMAGKGRTAMAGALAVLLLTASPLAQAASKNSPPPGPPPSYAALADLADSAPLVLRAELRKLALVEPERAPGVRPGFGRFYAEARIKALIAGNEVLGEAQRYLIDLPIDARGKPPPLTKKQVLLFARSVPGQPGVLQPVERDSQLLWDADTEARVRAILAELRAPDAPGRISGVREAIHVPGALAGEGETQIFLATPNGSAASITVRRRPGANPAWGASFSELTDNGVPPVRDTLAWYRLACFLPPALPGGVNLSDTPQNRAQAALDYRLVIASLGSCPRTRG
ncbi:MAG: hypothetical protein AB7F98_09900 [Novosphingobium sp.]